jgi:hypothetical protein
MFYYVNVHCYIYYIVGQPFYAYCEENLVGPIFVNNEKFSRLCVVRRQAACSGRVNSLSDVILFSIGCFN